MLSRIISLVVRYTVAQAAARLNRNRALIYRWLAEGRLRGEKFGYVWLVSERDLRRFLRQPPGRRRRRSQQRGAARA